jgi:hypothetical protein
MKDGGLLPGCFILNSQNTVLVAVQMCVTEMAFLRPLPILVPFSVSQ